MKKTYIINNAEKVIIPGNSDIQHTKYAGINIVISEITEERMFGGSFVKIAKKGNRNIDFVSSTLPEEMFKNFISKHYGINYAELYRYY